ncbi:hypothetical protein ACX9NE_16830 [Mycobacterium sp. ML4]
MIDIYSRCIVGVHFHTYESGDLTEELMEQIFKVHGEQEGKACGVFMG